MSNREHRYRDEQEQPGKYLIPEKKEQEPAPKEHRPLHWIYRLILILVLCAAAVAGWYNRANLSPENVWGWLKSGIVGLGVGDGYPKSFFGSTVEPANFISQEKNIIFASNTALSVDNSTGKELTGFQHSFSNPVLRVNGLHFMLYNMGGRNSILSTSAGTETKITTEQNIIAGAVSQCGKSVLLTAADNSCGMMTAYDASGNVVSYSWFSGYYPTAAALNPDGTKAAVTGVSAQNGTLSSAIYIIDLTGGQVVQPLAVSAGNLLCSVYWDTDSSVEAVGDASVVFLNPDSGTVKEYSFQGSILTAYTADAGRIALSLAPFESSASQTFLVLNSSGSQVFSTQISGQICSVSLYGQTAAALSDGNVIFCPLASSSVASPVSRSAGSDARAVALKDETSAYILGISEVRLVANK